MLYVKNVVYNLQVKWFHHLSLDVGLTWSHVIWDCLKVCIPAELYQGLHCVPESMLSGLNPFYAVMVCLYAHVNNLFFLKNKSLGLPVNLWGHPLSKSINLTFAKCGFCTIADLPVMNNKIDHNAVQNKLNNF